MNSITKLIVLLCIAGVTVLISRELPFILFGKKEIPKSVVYLGKVLPMAVMCILVLYCIKDISFGSAGGYVPQIVSLAVVSALHLWKRNTTLSIFAGTVCYMVLIRIM